MKCGFWIPLYSSDEPISGMWSIFINLVDRLSNPRLTLGK